MPEWRLAYVRTEDVDRLKFIVRPFLERACQRVETNLTAESIIGFAKTGQMRLWLVHDEVGIVSAFAVGEYEDRTAEFFSFAADRFQEWLPILLPKLEDAARAAGVKRLRIDGRKGWMRMMAKHGFVATETGRKTVKMDKEL